MKIKRRKRVKQIAIYDSFPYFFFYLRKKSQSRNYNE